MTKVLKESFIQKVEKKTGIPRKTLEHIWNESVKQEKMENKNPKSSKRFWKGVSTRFHNRLDEIEIQEARTVMSERDNLKRGIEQFMNSIAKEDYVGAKENMPSMVDSAWKSLINSKKDYYLRELAKKTQRKAKEA